MNPGAPENWNEEQREFLSRVVITETCWLWKGWKDNGRCVFKRPHIDGFKPISAARYSYLMHGGTIPMGMLVQPNCGHRRCVRFDHLVLLARSEKAIKSEPTADDSFTLTCTQCGHKEHFEGRWLLRTYRATQAGWLQSPRTTPTVLCPTCRVAHEHTMVAQTSEHTTDAEIVASGAAEASQ